jgi:Icc-related predicted phosphoesterase
MKLLLFSDLHRDTAAATRMVELSRHADAVIGAGDFANARTGVSTCIEILKVIEIPAVLVPGHIHASAGKRAQIADTIIINAGPAGLLLDLETVPTAA